MNCHRITQLEESYLLGDLEEIEMQKIRLHIEHCGSCNERIRAHEDLLGRLFSAIEPVSPPVYIRGQVVDKIKAIKIEESSPEKQIVSKKLKRIAVKPVFKLGFAGLYSLAASLLFVVALSWVILLQNQLQDSKQVQAQNSQLLALTSSSDSIVWIMQAPGQKPGPTTPSAKMYVRPLSDFYYVTATHLQSLPDGMIYSVWYEKKGEVEFGGNLLPDSTGNANLKIVDLSHTGTQINRCFITLDKISDNHETPGGLPLLEWKESVN